MAVIHVLDTNAVIAFMKDEQFLISVPDDTRLLVSVVTEIELLGWHAMTPDEEARCHDFLSSSSVVPLLPEIRDEAIALRRRHRLKTPDAIIAATALVVGGTLLTNDRKLLSIGEVPSRPLA